MGWAKNRDCEICHEWVGQCACNQNYEPSLEPDIPEEKLQEMQEECHQHFASLQPGEIPF